MLGFFRINDPFRLIAVVALIAVLSAIYLWVLELGQTQPELMWMLLGERLAEGKTMYRDILDNSGPLSAGTFWLIHLIFGKNIFAHKIIALALVMFQLSYLTVLFNRYRSFDENNYVPALVMALLFHASFDLISLSPALLGSTFIVLGLGQLFSQTVLQKEGTDSILLVGIFGGLAACFHFPLIFFLPYMILVSIVVSGVSFSQLLLSLIGYLIPILGCGVYYFWFNGLQEFISQYLMNAFTGDSYRYVLLREIALLYGAPLFFTSIGVIYGAVFRSLTVNQQKQMQLMLIYLLFAIPSLFLSKSPTPNHLITTLPAMTYFICMLFISLKGGLVQQILFSIFFLLTPLVGYSWAYTKLDSGNIKGYTVDKSVQMPSAKDKKILVLGNELGFYANAKLGGPYLNYPMSKKILENTEDHQTMAEIYQSFVQEKPEIIIDEEGVFEGLMKRIPALERSYEKSLEGWYIRK